MLKIIICMLILIQDLETKVFPQNIPSLSIQGHGIQLRILFGYLCFFQFNLNLCIYYLITLIST